MTEYAQEGQFSIVVALVVSVFVSAASWTLQCSVLYDCQQRGTCSPLYEGQCSFRNSVTPSAYRIFNITNDGDAIGSMTRGVCSPGERQNLDRSGNLVCVRAPSFPDAYIQELESDDSPPPTSDAQRTCGRWVDARSSVDQTQYWSFFDAEAVADDVENDIRSDGSANVAFDDIGRFRAECERMILNAAAAPSASNAYDHLKSRMPVPTNKVQVLHHVGVLLSHYCDTPVLYGIAFGPGNRFSINATSGSLLDADAATEALYAMYHIKNSGCRFELGPKRQQDSCTDCPSGCPRRGREQSRFSIRNSWHIRLCSALYLSQFRVAH